jgi:hypothetical protein
MFGETLFYTKGRISMSFKNNIAVQRALSFMLLNELLKKNRDTEAFKLGLIDSDGNIKKHPSNEEEELALSSFVLITLELKKILKGKLSSMYKFLYVNQYQERDILDRIYLRDDISNRIAIRRIEHDINKMFLEGIEKAPEEIKE